MLVRYQDATDRLEAERRNLERQTILQVADERERTARDLHDHVMQDLFATGLNLTGIASLTSDERVASRLESAVDQIDDAIKQLRTSIFATTPSPHRAHERTSDTVRQLVAQSCRVLANPAQLTIDGELDHDRWTPAALPT